MTRHKTVIWLTIIAQGSKWKKNIHLINIQLPPVTSILATANAWLLTFHSNSWSHKVQRHRIVAGQKLAHPSVLALWNFIFLKYLHATRQSTEIFGQKCTPQTSSITTESKTTTRFQESVRLKTADSEEDVACSESWSNQTSAMDKVGDVRALLSTEGCAWTVATLASMMFAPCRLLVTGCKTLSTAASSLYKGSNTRHNNLNAFKL